MNVAYATMQEVLPFILPALFERVLCFQRLFQFGLLHNLHCYYYYFRSQNGLCLSDTTYP
jgi:hypothetical protein